jgi:hypothetical protein
MCDADGFVVVWVLGLGWRRIGTDRRCIEISGVGAAQALMWPGFGADGSTMRFLRGTDTRTSSGNGPYNSYSPFVSPDDYEECARAGALILESHSRVGPYGEVTDKDEFARLAGSISSNSRHTEILKRSSEEAEEYLRKVNSFCQNLGIDEEPSPLGMSMYAGTESDQIEIAKRRQAAFRSGSRPRGN